jgi:hypothetical protein
MYCQSCGTAIAHSMKFCNRCGTSVATSQNTSEKKAIEKRLDDYLDGLFWITAFGVGLTAAGMVVLKKADLGENYLIAFVAISSTAFLINFLLSLWMVLGLAKKSKRASLLAESPVDTNQLAPLGSEPALHPAPSVIEHTTRSIEPIYNERNSD